MQLLLLLPLKNITINSFTNAIDEEKEQERGANTKFNWN
jgi:hypothetical protein